MILCPLADLPRYAPLHPLMPAAAAWLAGASRREGITARTAIRGDDLFVLPDAGTTRDPAAGRLESHRAHADIQISLAGGESILWLPVEGLGVAEDFKPDNDIRFHAAPPRAPARIPLPPGWAMVLFPEDAHQPTCHLGDGPAAYRKLVIKLRLAAT